MNEVIRTELFYVVLQHIPTILDQGDNWVNYKLG